MLHIILGILKIIGILLGIMILLLFAGLLALVFVPVRYRLTAKVQPGQSMFSLQGSWLLHIISAAAIVDPSQKGRIEIRLFGIRLPLFRPEGGGKEKKKRRGRRKKKEKEPEAQERNEKRTVIADPQKGRQDSPGQGDMEPEPEPPKKSISQKIWFQCKRICDKIRQIIQGVGRFRQKLADLGRRAADLARRAIDLLRKPGELMNFLEEYEAREVFGCLVGHLLFLIAHYKPRRIRGYLRFGTGDPATTGQLTGLIYILLPARADRYSVEPEFSETVFETETSCSGHIRALHLLRVLWRGFRDRKLRRLIAAYRGSERRPSGS